MKRISVLLFVASVAVLPWLLSCGGDSSGTPGVEGQWNPVFELVTPIYCDTKDLNEPAINNEVDAYFDPSPCNPADPGSPPEVFTDHKLLIRMWNADYPGNPGSAYPVTLTRFHIDFRRPETAGDTAPILPSVDRAMTVGLLPANLDDPENRPAPTFILLDLVDLATKDDFRRQFDTGERIPPDFPTRYTAVVTMYGSSIVDKNLKVVVTADFTIGNWDYCHCND